MSNDKSERGFPKKTPSTESTGSAGHGEIISRMAVHGLEDVPWSLLSDCSVLLMHCPRCNRFAQQKMARSKGQWLPFVTTIGQGGWNKAVKEKMKEILALPLKSSPNEGSQILPHSNPEVTHYVHLQLPFTSTFITRTTFFSKLLLENKSSPCCESLANKETVWVPFADLSVINRPESWGPEGAIYGEAFLLNGSLPPEKLLTEHTLRDVLKYVPNQPPTKEVTIQEELVKAARFSEQDCLTLYSDFLQHVYPSMFMVFPSFEDFLRKKGWSGRDRELVNIYHAFRFLGLPYLSFQELFLGLASMEKNSPNGDLRTEYIFRYYDINDEKDLSRAEMSRMTEDTLKLKNRPHDEGSIAKELNGFYDALKMRPNEPVNIEKLGQLIGWTDPSPLFRSPLTGSALVHSVYTSIAELQPEIERRSGRAKGKCTRCREKKYALASHCVRVNASGNIENPQEINQQDVKNAPEGRRIRSKENFSGDYVANKVLDWVREYAEASAILRTQSGARSSYGTTKNSKKATSFWSTVKPEMVLRTVEKLCQEVERLLRSEARVVKVSSPAYVVGDIRGNLHDLLIFERLLWRRAPLCDPASYLFLGNYADRGPNGVECIIYLLAMKLLSPEKIWLIRGAQEVRNAQKTLKQEVLDKFGTKNGANVWELINRVFDNMPLAGIVDESVYCAHAGIPSSAPIKLEDLLSIPCPLNDPENQSLNACDMMRNISITDQAVAAFSQLNGLSHIIHSQEVVPIGFQLSSKGRVITIMSTSKTNGGNNEAACVFVDQEKVRILRMDTGAQ